MSPSSRHPAEQKSTLSAARDIVITGDRPTFVNYESSPGKTGLQLLHNHTAPGATHDTAERFPPPKCHPETRREIVQRIVNWITDSAKEERILWLTGPVGAGKSAIAQTLAELFRPLRNANANTNGGDITLAASFFFSRTAQRRNTGQFLIPTLAYQIGMTFPKAGEMINGIIEEDSSVLHKSPKVQFWRLVVEPLQRSLRDTGAGRTGPVVIIIDGLDECSGEDKQCLILQLIGSVFESDSDLGQNPDDREAQPKFPIYFIASRPEPWIRDEFSTGTLAKVVKEVSLAEALQVDEDIRIFYRSAFVDICDSLKHRQTMANVPRPWPTDATIELLVEKASGQFQYASTVVKFVDDPQHRPTDRLDVILGLPTPHSNSSSAADAFAELDRLYTQILSTCVDRERTCNVLGTLFAMSTAASNLRLWWAPRSEMLDVAERLLELRPGDADLALRTIHSLIYVWDSTGGSGLSLSLPEDYCKYTSHEPAFCVHHKSSMEFLLDRARSGEYFIDMEMINGRLALRCLYILTQGPPKAPDAPGMEYVIWGYALLRWTDHCVHSRLTPQLLQALAGFNFYSKYVVSLKDRLFSNERKRIKRRTTHWFPLFNLFPALETTGTANPNPSDDRYLRARNFVVSHGGGADMTLWRYGSRLGLVADWISRETSQFPSWLIKGRLVTGYRAVANILQKAYDRHAVL